MMIRILSAALVLTMISAAVPSGGEALWYDRPAAKWEEALPIGNGRLGAMVFGGGPHERIQFNEHTVWTGAPRSYAHVGAVKVLPELRALLFQGKQKEAETLAMKEFMSDPIRQTAYQPCGDLRIDALNQPDMGKIQRSLDLDTGVVVTEWSAGGRAFRSETFASHPANLVVTRMSSDQPSAIEAVVRLDSPHKDSHITVEGDNQLVVQGRVSEGGVAFEARAVVVVHGGSMTHDEHAITIHQADAIEIRLAAATNVENWKSLAANPSAIVQATIARAKNTPYQKLLESHLADHRSLYRSVSIDLGRSAMADVTTDRRIAAFRDGNDPQLAALLFQYGRYLLIASSRDGGQPANLQGIWNDSMAPQWDSKYTCNINTEMNYWPAETTGLAECAHPLFQALSELRESGSITAREHYGARGWVLHHNFDLWRGTAPINASDHGIWPTGGAWLSMHLWEHYQFSGDRKFLKEYWPVMRDAALFFTDYLTEDPKTKALISGPSNSPEQGGLVMGPTMDHQIIRELFKACSQAARVLGTDEELASKLDAMRARIAPNKIGRYGQLQEWMEDKDDPKNQHRHVSHLWGVFPGADITWKQPLLYQAASKSLVFRGDAATGWSMGWKTNLWARFLDGNHAYVILSNLMQPLGRAHGQGGLYPNMFDAHPPFQIDGNFGVTSGIAEMLLQSHIPVDESSKEPRFMVHLLPALPSAWPSGSVTGLRARGGIRVDMTWQEGVLSKVTMMPSVSGPVTVKLGDRMVTVTGKAGKRIELNGSLSAS